RRDGRYPHLDARADEGAGRALRHRGHGRGQAPPCRLRRQARRRDLERREPRSEAPLGVPGESGALTLRKSKSKLPAALAVALSLTAPLFAHDFWIEPS